MLKVILRDEGNRTRAEFRELPALKEKTRATLVRRPVTLLSAPPRRRMTGGRKRRTFYNVCSCRRRRTTTTTTRNNVTATADFDRRSYAAHAFLPSFPALSEWLILALGEECTAAGEGGKGRKEGGKTNLPMGRFFLALPPPPSHPPCSLFSFPLVWIAFALDGIAITKKGKGFPPLSHSQEDRA